MHISGSASFKTGSQLTQYSHDLLSQVVRNILRDGGGLVVGAGKEPRPGLLTEKGPSVVFDWTILETAAECLRAGRHKWPKPYGPPIVVVTSGKSEMEIPEDRRALWDSLLLSGWVQVETIQAGARSGTMLRERQAQYGDILLTLGGGTGVEHLANLYMGRRRPVIPLDIPLGASRNDALIGSEGLALKSREQPKRFIKLQKPFAGSENARLASIATRSGAVDVRLVSNNLTELLRVLAPPYVFYTRLLNHQHEKFSRVESFFRDVVDPVVEQCGFDRIDMEVDDTEHPFINLAVFDDLHYASVVIADVTGERPNCYIELGYALGHATRVIVTAEEGTKRPFDQDAIPCHFWDSSLPVQERQEAFIDFWRKNINRPPLIG
ncbi:MAG TPA: hypothetical protein VF658_21245 [Pyrinomonadaceae bacterium]